jgi:hypothetical protein
MKTKISILLSGLLLATCIVKAQQGPPPGQKPPSPEEHLKQVSAKLEKELALSPAQKMKVEAAYKQFFTGMEKVRGKMQPPPPPPPPLPPGKKKSADSLAAIRDAEIKKTLTDAQFTKFKEVEKTMRPPRRQGPPPPAPNKQ